MLLKVTYIFNIILQFCVLSYILDFTFFSWGYRAVVTHKIDYFSYINFCDFSIREPGNEHAYSVQCFFAINLFNKFVFITIWLWLIMLFFANFFTLIYWIIMFIPRYRRIFLKKYIKHGLSMSFLAKMPTDLYLFILFINSHDGSISN